MLSLRRGIFEFLLARNGHGLHLKADAGIHFKWTPITNRRPFKVHGSVRFEMEAHARFV